jgi:cytochrome c oxidase cbb3-type subunit 3
MTRALLLWLSLTALALAGCEREHRHYEGSPPFVAAGASAPQTALGPEVYEHNAWAVAEGKRWFRWFNCNGCHASGGGDSGPALMDDEWRYGGSQVQIVASILQGRPNGMPSFAARISQDQAHQLAAYILSASGQLRTDVAPSRSDTLSPGAPEQRREQEQPKAGDPAPAPR